jgi:HPt (histidine-containing phosphotransfer) domain-containing protein
MPGRRNSAATAQPEAGMPPVDYQCLLQRCLNKPELAARLLRKLLEQAGHDVAAITTAAQQNDAAGLAAVAHRLKGASANVAAEPMRRLAATLEELGRRGDLAAVSHLLPQLKSELLRLKSLPESIAQSRTVPATSEQP